MVEGRLNEIWVYLAASPLLWLTATLTCYLIALRLYRLAASTPLLNPVMVAIALLIGLLWLTDTPYRTYFEGAQFVHFLLGPATVALAIPLYRQRQRLRALALPILVALPVGVATAGLSAIGLAALFGAEPEILLSLAPKSVTAPVAMGISEKIGGIPTLTAVLVISTGVVGAVFGTAVLRLLRCQDPAVKGFALGLSAHGLGTARAFQIDATMGAFAGLAMALSALTTALLLPPLLSWIGLS
ncbi:LrgB family protein [Lamprobacter modestohalophilus]|uniref:LrgB family protein n=1 Tax=Lamprobacter modestohalophilus TaxID=1064514 RepID=UPI002ADED77A|nr:LrgB family protein [Lamprobacter modestohalophilus]MEA1049834.1 LrgB family protein [Lamprobacter modestohalophilus]